MPETRGAFERGTGVKAVAKIDEHRICEQAIGPREKRGFIEQDEIINAAESVRSGLPTSELSIRFFGYAGMRHRFILSANLRKSKKD